MIAIFPLDLVRDLAGPGLVFLALAIWLVRKALKAARTESELEAERLRQALGDLLPDPREASANANAIPTGTANPTPIPTASALRLLAQPEASARPAQPRVPQVILGADVRGAAQEHLDALAAYLETREHAARALGGRSIQILWVRSGGSHVAWCERRRPAAGARANEVIGVARIEGGKLVARWSFG